MAPAVHDHLRPTTAEYPDGIYRVVGTGEEAVTLLRVANADGRRRHTGEVVTVERDRLDGFEAAANPDGNVSVGALVVSTARTAYWSVRTVLANLLADPVGSVVVFALLAAGFFGPDLLDVPEPAGTALVVLGALGVAYVGSGRRS